MRVCTCVCVPWSEYNVRAPRDLIHHSSHIMCLGAESTDGQVRGPTHGRTHREKHRFPAQALQLWLLGNHACIVGCLV